MATVHRRSQRTSNACDFCRKRKLGCDNAKPKCENCQGRVIECTYTKRTKQARPSNARIHSLEEENAQLRELLRLQSVSLNRDQSSNSSQPPLGDSTFAPDHQYSASDTIHVSETVDGPHPDVSLSHSTTPNEANQTPFHGPSSVVFEPETPRPTVGATVDTSNLGVKNQLLAETTRQRQYEVINFKAGKLDFGGIDPALGMELLSNFWNRQHYAGSIVYRPGFMRDMVCKGPYYSDLLLNAILFAGSKYSDDPAARSNAGDKNSAGRPFRAKFEEILQGSQVLFKSRVTTIQGLLIVADALFSWCDETSLSWHYMGLAISMIVDLGIHVDGVGRARPESCTPEDVEVHRRVFWAAFALDKVQSIYQGRPARLREADNRVPIQFLDEYEELEEFNTNTYSEHPTQMGCPTYSVSTFKQLCKLSIIMDRILCNLYSEKSCYRDPQELFDASNALHAELKRWRSEMPAHLLVHLNNPGNSTILPHTLSLLAMYNSLVILLHRPFVSDGHLQSVSASAARDAFSHCAVAALEIHHMLQVYRQHFCLKSVPYFVSYATYVSATIHVRMAAQRGPESGAHKYLRSCLEILGEHQAKCFAPRRTMRVLLAIMDRLNVHVGDFSALATSSCQAEVVARPVEATFSQPTRQASNPKEQLPNDHQGDFDLVLTDLDMDEIMKTFNLAPEAQPVSMNEDLATERFLPSQDTLPLSDVLFGFDFNTI
ncbi:fungal-specific transcription factor domain-containing protein [Fusarium solani]|uniref:Fungal-specific transcription factor domain-containing protein n=1 Tax=Fusarium solani TaxID=169388 RepID=A0A9P9JSA7_FUSSL|nr:fungal-specific transcription factor domain-containing protein [Fusarium solani]KAH7235063.1 fungal-specific transcription factor domain-containing protein [Fusarium solani]